MLRRWAACFMIPRVTECYVILVRRFSGCYLSTGRALIIFSLRDKNISCFLACQAVSPGRGIACNHGAEPPHGCGKRWFTNRMMNVAISESKPVAVRDCDFDSDFDFKAMLGEPVRLCEIYMRWPQSNEGITPFLKLLQSHLVEKFHVSWDKQTEL